MDKNQKEKMVHATEHIPYSYYKSEIPYAFPMVGLHWHNEIELNYIIDGIGEFTIGSEKLIPQKGDIIIIPPKALHSVFTIDDTRFRYDTLVFDKGLLGAYYNDRSSQEFLMPLLNSFEAVYITKQHYLHTYLQPVVENIFSCAIGNSAELDFLLKIELSKLFWVLNRDGSIIRTSPKKPSDNEIILKALKYIEENYNKQITLDKISDYVNLSKSYFMSYFKSIVGTSAIEYLTQLRIKKVCEMLNTGDKKIIDIAYECGFNNISNFNRHYKRIMQCTPEEYRNSI